MLYSADLIAKLLGTKAIIADKGYDSKCMREQITKKGARAVIPEKRGSLKGNANMDWGLYRYGHGVENTFARLKQCRVVTVRYDKLKGNFERKYGNHGHADICNYPCKMSTDLKLVV